MLIKKILILIIIAIFLIFLSFCTNKVTDKKKTINNNLKNMHSDTTALVSIPPCSDLPDDGL